jgi:uncharacterized protein (DUF2461 family)
VLQGQPRALARGHGGAGGLYVELSLDGVFVAAGLHRPSSDQLERFRAAIDDERRAERFEEAVASSYRREPRARGAGLKRAPRGYAPDHPRIDLLRLRELTVHRRHALEPWLHEPRGVDVVRADLEAARPLVTWLGEHVGAAGAPAPARWRALARSGVRPLRCPQG